MGCSAEQTGPAGGFLAALTPLPWGVTLGQLRPLVGQLLDGRPERWQARQL